MTEARRSLSDLDAELREKVQKLLRRCNGFPIEENFLVLFERPYDATRFSLAYHEALREVYVEDKEAPSFGQVAVHVGEVAVSDSMILPARDSGSRASQYLGVDEEAKIVVTRLLRLAQKGQTLLTEAAYDIARRGLLGQSSVDASGELEDESAYRWADHGSYRIDGVEEVIRVFEIGRSAHHLAPPAQSAEGVRCIDRTPRGGRRRFGRRLIAATVVLWIVALSLVAASLLRDPVAQGVKLGDRESVAVLGLQNLSGRQEHDWMSVALSEMLSTDLAAGARLRLISGENIARMRGDLGDEIPEGQTVAADTLSKIRNHLNTDYIVVGSYVVAGQGQTASQLESTGYAQAERTIITKVSEGTEAGLFELISQASTDLRRDLGAEGLSENETAEVRAALSSSPEATRLYAEGLAKLRGFDALAARDLFTQSVAVDPEYALAHVALSQAWARLGFDEKAARAAERAAELKGELSREEQLLIEGQHYATATQWEAAIDTYEVLWGYFPDHLDYGLRLADAQSISGNGSDALVTLDQLAVLPGASEDPRVDLSRVASLHAQGKIEDVRAVAERAIVKASEQGSDTLLAEGRLWLGTEPAQIG